MTLVELVSVAGLTFGVTGTVLGVLNYLRDRARIVVDLQWDMSVAPPDPSNPDRLWGVVRVTNVGRRPAYVSHVVLRVPNIGKHTHLVLTEGIQGTKLLEGDPPKSFLVSQVGLEKYASRWREVIAQVSGGSGRVWSSPKPSPDRAPSWSRKPAEV